MADLKVGTTIGGSPVWHQGNLALVPSGNAILYKGARIYSENDKPSANELQVVSRAGDTMTGQLVVETSTDYPLALKSSVNGPSYIRFSKGNTLQSYVGTDSAGDFKIAMTNGAGSWAFDGIKIAKSDATVSFKGNLQSDATGNFDIKYGSIQFIRANSLKDLYIGAPGGTDLVLGYAQDGMTTTKIRMNSAVYNKTGGLLISDTGQIQRSAMDNPYYNQTEADARFIRLNTNTATTGYLLSKSVNTGTPDNLSMGYSGFFRHDTSSGFRDLTINVAHPNFSNGAHARGITFNLGSTDYKLYTYAYDASGTRLANQKIYTEADKPTPTEIGALAAGANAVSASKLQTARTISLTGGATGSVSFDGSANASLAVTVTNDSHTHSDYVKKIGDTMSGNLTAPKVLLSATQGTEANSVARRDFVESTVTASGKGVKDLTITLPAGAPATGYIPVLFETNGKSNSFVFIDTSVGISSHPMNNCSFIGNVRASGWSDGGSYAYGMFTIHSESERAIHSIHGPAENSYGFVVYVETRAFPIYVRVDIGTTVTAYATDATYGTSVFKVNGQVSGNTKTIVLANFDKDSGTYNGSNRVYDNGYNPTPEAVGALPVNGNAATASRLQTARLIAGVPFDGTSNISISATNVGAVAKAGDTMSGPLTVNAPLAVGSPSSQQTTTLNGYLQIRTGNYGCRVTAAGERGYFQAGNAVDTTQPHQMTLSGWAAEPLTSLEIRLKDGSIWFNSDSTIAANVAPTASNHLVNKAYADTKVSLAGSTLYGQLSSTATFEASSSNAQIFHNCKGTTGAQINIRSMRESTGSFWLWEKVASGNLYYSTGTNGAGTNKIRMAVSTGEIYLGDANKRVYHEGFKPTPADIDAVNKTGDTMTGPLTISNTVPFIVFNETDTGKNWLLVVDGSGCRFQMDGFGGLEAWNVNPSGVITLNSPHTAAAQGTNPSSLTRKDYVDNQVATRAPTAHTHTVAAITDLNPQDAAATANTLALRDAFGGLNARLLRTTYGDELGMNGAIAFRANNSTDNSTRYCSSPSAIRDWMKGAKTDWQMGWRAYIEHTDNPMTEYHIPGKTAVLTYLTGDGVYRIDSSNGGGGAVGARMSLDSSGNLYVVGNGNFNDVNIRSDRRLKKNFVKISGALDKVSQLCAYTYDKKQALSSNDYSTHEVGLIAQDVQLVLPEAVTEVVNPVDNLKVLTMSNSGVNALLVEAIKELTDRVKYLESKIN